MATDAPARDAPRPRMRREPQTSSLAAPLVGLFKAAASLKLTVTLLAISMFLVFAGTMALTRYDMWDVVDKYFRAWFVWVEFQIFFPAAFFPVWSQYDIALSIFGWRLDGFPLPGGWVIGGLMAINLVAAHSLRFKMQARGPRLALGLLALALGLAVLTLVILAFQNDQGIQTHTWVNYDLLWQIMRYGVVALWLGLIAATVYAFTKFDASRQIERWTLFASAFLLGGLAVYLLSAGGQTRMGDSGMRILWQLINGMAVGLVLLAGCVLVFKKRAGIVLLHFGIGFLMFNELWVATTHVEARMILEEEGGRPDRRSANWVQDIRKLELAVIERGAGANGGDHTVAIPQAMFLAKNDNDNYQRIEDDRLPFDVRLVKFHRNSTFHYGGPGIENPADTGQGTQLIAKPAPLVTAVDGDKVNESSAYVRFFDKESSEPLGTHLLSVHQTFLARWHPTELDHLEEITVGGKTYEVYLRYMRINKPYRVTLLDVSKQDYIGTNTPMDYASEVVVEYKDEAKGVDVNSEERIWMNNPLRFAGDTLYQSSWHAPSFFTQERTTLSVVSNQGWMIPYLCCMIVGVGMAFQFGVTLLRFLNRRATETAASARSDQSTDPLGLATATEPSPPQHRPATSPKRDKKRRNGKRPAPQPVATSRGTPPWLNTLGRWFPLIVVVVFGLWMFSKARPAKAPAGEMQIYHAGKLPIVYQGRVKPLDTLARNSLRVISGREELILNDGQDDKEKLPAILWLLDVISASQRADDYRVFRIENLEVLQVLGLRRREGLRYSLAEIERGKDEFDHLVRQAGAVASDDPRNLTFFQRKILEVSEKLEHYNKLRFAFAAPAPSEFERTQAAVGYLQSVAQLAPRLGRVPLAVPIGGATDETWQPLTVAAARVMLQQAAQRRNIKSMQQLQDVWTKDLTEEEIERQVNLLLLRNLEAFIAGMEKDKTPDEVRRIAAEKLAGADAKIRKTLGEDKARELVTADRLAIAGAAEARIGNAMAAVQQILGEASLTDTPNAVAVAWTEFLTARRSDDVRGFNDGIEQCQLALTDAAPAKYSGKKTGFEAFFNQFAPFYWGMGLYVAAFVMVGLSWLGWTRPLNGAAFWVIVFTLAIHTFGLIARIYISGRPPVTNLYSSAVFIGWGAVVFGLVMEMIFRIGVGNVLASVCGFAGLLIAHNLTGDGDTLIVMQAVLDTNFWLATHVVCITLGYTTTFLAGVLGIIYVLCGVLSPRLTPELSRLLARKIYGIVCFSILFSFIGTVLGGLWADDSWGRFWGWDPKENGALIIVIWNAIVLHARWGGMVKERGLAVLAMGGNIVTAWSWFGVNELGVGLHSYGFTDGVLLALGLFVAVQLVLIVVGSLPKSWWWSFSDQNGAGQGGAK